MPSANSSRSAVRDDEGGVSLVELLVVMMLTTVVAGMTIGIVVQSFQQERTTTARVVALNEGKTTLERMTRDVRAANPVLMAEEDLLRIEVDRDGTLHRRTWEVDGSVLELIDEVLDQDGTVISTSTSAVLRRLQPAQAVFSYRDAEGEEPDSPMDVRTVRLDFQLVDDVGNIVNLHDELTVRNARRWE